MVWKSKFEYFDWVYQTDERQWSITDSYQAAPRTSQEIWFDQNSSNGYTAIFGLPASSSLLRMMFLKQLFAMVWIKARNPNNVPCTGSESVSRISFRIEKGAAKLSEEKSVSLARWATAKPTESSFDWMPNQYFAFIRLQRTKTLCRLFEWSLEPIRVLGRIATRPNQPTVTSWPADSLGIEYELNNFEL